MKLDNSESRPEHSQGQGRGRDSAEDRDVEMKEASDEVQDADDQDNE